MFAVLHSIYIPCDHRAIGLFPGILKKAQGILLSHAQVYCFLIFPIYLYKLIIFVSLNTSTYQLF